jgi:hypothetical protein
MIATNNQRRRAAIRLITAMIKTRFGFRRWGIFLAARMQAVKMRMAGGESEITCVHVRSTSNFWVNQLAIEIVAV